MCRGHIYIYIWVCVRIRVCVTHIRVCTHTWTLHVHMSHDFTCWCSLCLCAPMCVCVLPSEMECVLFYSRKIGHRAICCIMYPSLNTYYLISSHLISSHLTLPHLTWPHCLILSNLILSYLCTIITSSPTYTCIRKYLTLPKITLYESCHFLVRFMQQLLFLDIMKFSAVLLQFSW